MAYFDSGGNISELLRDIVFRVAAARRTSTSTSCPFTRLRSDGIWVLDREVPMDAVGPLAAQPVAGRFAPEVDKALADDPELLASAARAFVDSPDTIASEVPFPS